MAEKNAGDVIREGLLNPTPETQTPEKQSEETKINAASPEQTPEPKTDATAGVDGERERDRGSRGPSKQDTIRELRRDRRELRAKLEEFERRFQEFERKRQEPANTDPKAESDEEYLTKLLTKPLSTLSEREKKLVDRLDALERRISETPTALKREYEVSEAFKRLKGLEGINVADENAGEELVEFLSERTGLEPEFLEKYAKQSPLKFAELAEKHWKESRKLSDKVSADKKAASSTPSGGGKQGGTASLEDIRAAYMKEKDPEKARKLEEQMIALGGLNALLSK